MYEKFFNLKTKPFELVPNPEFLFLSRSHKKAMTYLDYGIKEKIGFVLLSGEVGSGKTTIVRSLIKELNNKFRLSKVFNTKVSSEQLVAMINEDFGLNVKGKDKITLLRELNDFLIEQYANKYQSILIIDEAQNLTSELLEEIRLLSNLETDRSKLLQIILVGQPELRKTFSRPELRQFRQRISMSCHIQNLTKEETEEYILHRLEIAGNRSAVNFHNGTIDVIYDFSRGIPRLINIICDFLMVSAFVEETRELSLELVKEVIGELEVGNRYWEDEAQEHYLLENKADLALAAAEPSTVFFKISRENFMRLNKEIINRLGRIEEEFFKSQSGQDEMVEILERLSTSEQLLNNFITNTKAEISGLSGSVNEIVNELVTVKNLIDEFENRFPIKADTKKTGFWKRIFRNVKCPEY